MTVGQPLPGVGAASVTLDLVIRNGTVYDGTGGEPSRPTSRSRAAAIARSARSPPADAPELDAAGPRRRARASSTSTATPTTRCSSTRARASAIHQGVTLEVVGNCGFGCFPIVDPELARKAIYGYSDDVPIEWSTAGGYFDRLERARPAVNVLSLVPNGQLRLATVGLADRAADGGRARRACGELLRESLGEGAWGYSTGLEYAQESGATEEEITALCRALDGQLYATHTRRRDAGQFESVEEAIRTAEHAEARLQVSHLVPRNGIEESAPLDRARRARPRPRPRRRVRHAHAPLRDHAPLRGAAAVGARRGRPRRAARATPPRATGCARTAASSAPATTGRASCCFDNPFWPEYARRDLAEIAAERGQEPLDAVYDLLVPAVEEPHRLMVIINAYDEQEQREAFAHPCCVPGSDATTLAPDGPLAESFFHGAYTWASWFWRFMVRERAAALTRPRPCTS